MIIDVLAILFVWLATYVVGRLLLSGLLKVFKPQVIGDLGFNLVLGMAAISCLGIWGIYFGGGAILVTKMLVILLLVCIVSAMARRPPMPKRFCKKIVKIHAFEKCFILFATVISMSPQLSKTNMFSLGVRIGPDAIGYGVSAQAIALETSRFAIESDVEKALNYGDINAALSAKVQSIYQIPSVTDQIRAEYIIGARRWGVLAFESIFTRLFGTGYVWLVQVAVAGLGILVTSLLISDYLRHRQVSLGIRLGVVIFITASPAILNAWHEGGIAQGFTLPAVALLAVAFLEGNSKNNLISIVLSVVGYVLLLGSYNDAIFLIWVTFFIALTILLLGGQFAGALIFCKRQITSFAAAMILSMPLISTFAGAISSRSEDAAQGGWPQPNWPNLSDFLGITNMFRHPLGDSTNQSNSLSVELVSLVLAIWILFLFRNRFKSQDFILVISALLTLELILIKTKYFDLVSNYQVAKASASLTPMILVGIAIGIENSLHVNARSLLFQKILVSGLGAAGLVAGISWHSDWKNLNGDQIRVATHASTDSRAISKLPEVRAAFDEFDFIQPPTAASNIPASFGNFHWINRGVAGKSVRASKPSRPLAIWLDEFNCPELSCLGTTREENVIAIAPTKAILMLNDDSQILDGISPAESCDYLNSKWISMGGLGAENCFPLGSE